VSHTISRGLSTAAHWSTAAGNVDLYLRSLQKGRPVEVLLPASIQVLKVFFKNTLAGITFDKRRKLPKGIYSMAAVSCLSITLQVFKMVESRSVSLEFVASKIAEYISTIEKLPAGKVSRQKSRNIRKFLGELRRQGELDLDTRLTSYDDDD